MAEVCPAGNQHEHVEGFDAGESKGGVRKLNRKEIVQYVWKNINLLLRGRDKPLLTA